jgi:peptidoglycan L-alanyl-D-glutamate endopeptidase CwlK
MNQVNADVDSLADPFKAKAQRLLDMIEREGLPFRLFEARRSFTRSAALFMQGRAYKNGVLVKVGPTVSNARAGESPHNWGLAIDCVLDCRPEHAWWAGEALPKGPWDLGKADHISLAWVKYGRCVRACDLSWGGDWTGFKDWPHAEARNWRQYRPSNYALLVQREVDAGR